MKILLAIPCYRCAPQISRVLSELDESLLRRLSEVAVFENRSQDDTLTVAKRSIEALHGRHPELPQAHVFENNENYGLGGTHKIAFQYAERNGFDYMAIVHGDNQAKTSELHELIDRAEKDPSLDAVLGARFMPGSRLKGYSLLRTLGNRGLNGLYELVTWRTTYDLGSGLNLFKVSAFRDRRFLNYSDGFTFNMDLLLDLFKKNCKVLYVPITWSESDQISNAKMFRVGWKTLLTLFKWRFGLKSFKPASELTYLTSRVQ